MKNYSFLLSVIVVLIAPAIMFSMIPVQTENVTQTSQTTMAAIQVKPEHHTVRVKTESGIEIMELDEYVACVLMGEMPADFEKEALKAQAVAIRTYTLKKLGGGKHPDADVCEEPSCCQAFVDLRESTQSEAVDRITGAVNETKGEVVTYNGQLIDATYFSCSGGLTEDAVAVWGADVPYLQSRKSPGEEDAAHYVTSVKMTAAEFLDKMNLTDAGSIDIGAITYTDGRGVDTIEICGKTFDGTQVRGLLGLSSTAFRIQAVDNSVVITTKGNGHRVGLSQYGAEAMAVSGSTYRQILEYYYSGTTVEKWSDDQIQGVFDKAGIL